MIDTATTDDVVARSLRPLTDAEIAWADVRLGDAFTQIITEVPSVGVRLDSATVSVGFVSLVGQIQCAMVLRVLQNPDGILEESGDDYTRRLDASVSTGALYLTDAEVRLLTADATGADGAFSVRAVPVGAYASPFPTSTTDTWTGWPY